MPKLPNILIVDDYKSFLEYLELSLSEVQANVISASSGPQALELIKDMDLALAILDVQMEPMSGLELARAIHSKQSNLKCPVIFMTSAYPDVKIAYQGYNAGAFDYIYKPVDHHILMSKIRVFLELHEQRQRETDRTERLEASEAELRLAKKQLEDLNKHTIRAVEEEKTKISMQVHDELGQHMTALKMDLFSIKSNQQMESGVYIGRVDRMIETTNELIRKIQRISLEMHPSILNNLGLVEAIEWYCGDFEERTGISCMLELEEGQRMEKEIELALYRVMQEAMTNIIRHARASKVNIQLNYGFHKITLQITDNGSGMPADKLGSVSSMGLLSMRQRIKHCQGEISFSNIKQGGLCIHISIPVNSDWFEKELETKPDLNYNLL